MGAQSDLRSQLIEFEDKWRHITATPESPRTLMNVIEYTLGKQIRGEVYVTRLLRYLLDPEEPHGMGDEFLRAFLDELRAHQRRAGVEDRVFSEDVYDLSDVDVDDQVGLGIGAADGNSRDSSGLVDIVVDAPNEWFALIELKFSATENNRFGDGPSQTEAYSRATHVGEQPKDEYESGGYYVYLHRQDTAVSADPAFTDWTWSSFIDHTLADFIATNGSRYPHRTVVQLQELQDDIRTFPT